MFQQLKRKALNWAHKVLCSWRTAIEQELEAMDPFTRDDMRDELLNRYPV